MTRTKQTQRRPSKKKRDEKEALSSRNPQAKEHRQRRETLKANLAKTAPKTTPQPTNNTSSASAEETPSLSIQDESTNISTASTNTNTNPPQSLPTTITIPPSLQKSHATTTMSIISSSQIQQKVTKALSLLSTYPTVPPAKPAVVVLYAKAKAASKMVSIAEIVKREIGALDEGKAKWFQYNWVEGFVEEHKPKEDLKGNGKEMGNEDVEMGDGDEDAESEEEGFEVMKTPFERAIEGTKKVRAVPIMSIYLSRVRIESLRREYGEQTNALELPQQ